MKRNSFIGLAILVGLGIAMPKLSNSLQAATHKLEYPQGWGTCCPVNSAGWGHYQTAWREWPGEIRLDKTFPKAVGMERIPTPAGQEMLPLPKATRQPKAQAEGQPDTGEGTFKLPEGLPGNAMPGENQTPGENPTQPGTGMQNLPGLPQDSGGFNPLPGLPPDLGTPTMPGEKKNETPSNEPKSSEPKSDSSPKNKIEIPSVVPKSYGKGVGYRTPQNSIKTSRQDALKQLPKTRDEKNDSTSMVQPSVYGNGEDANSRYEANLTRGAMYHEPIESQMTTRLMRDVESQVYKQTADSTEASVIVQSGFVQTTNPAEMRHQALIVALDGYCPVELSLHGRWTQGDQRWTAEYKGFKYCFSGNTQRQEFLSNPEKYIPGNGGYDPVLSVNEKRNIAGQVNYCAAYKGRIFMFTSSATQQAFHANPEMYVGSQK